MGVCNGQSHDSENFTIGSLSQDAIQLRDQEQSIFLANVPYETFWGKVKLVGYTMHLRPDHMRLISEHINLDYDKDILSYEKSEAKALLCDPNFGYVGGVHEPRKLLLTGFMYCSFRNEIEHMDNLWHLINPNFKGKVSLDVIQSTLEDLLYIAIDQRLNMLDEENEANTNLRIYLEQCEKFKADFVERIRDELQAGDEFLEHFTKGQFMQTIIPAVCRPSNLRQLVLHKTSQARKTFAKESTTPKVRALSVNAADQQMID